MYSMNPFFPLIPLYIAQIEFPGMLFHSAFCQITSTFKTHESIMKEAEKQQRSKFVFWCVIVGILLEQCTLCSTVVCSVVREEDCRTLCTLSVSLSSLFLRV